MSAQWTDPEELRRMIRQPAQPGFFTDEEKERIRQRVVEVGIHDNAVCPLCKNTQWSLGEMPVRMPAGGALSDRMMGKTRNYPCVALFCSRCGNTHVLNLIVLGLRDIAEAIERR